MGILIISAFIRRLLSALHCSISLTLTVSKLHNSAGEWKVYSHFQMRKQTQRAYVAS